MIRQRHYGCFIEHPLGFACRLCFFFGLLTGVPMAEIKVRGVDFAFDLRDITEPDRQISVGLAFTEIHIKVLRVQIWREFRSGWLPGRTALLAETFPPVAVQLRCIGTRGHDGELKTIVGQKVAINTGFDFSQFQLDSVEVGLCLLLFRRPLAAKGNSGKSLPGSRNEKSLSLGSLISKFASIPSG